MKTERQRHIVITDQSHGLPYSKGLMASSLMSAGLPPTTAFAVAERIEENLLESGRTEISSGELRDIAAGMLAEVGDELAQDYLKWQAVEELEIPLIIMLGGATGVGKSTLATRLAVRLGISRVISTDAIRQVLRSIISRDLMPTLHVSSYEAGEALQVPVPARADPLIVGFQRQVDAVSVGVKGLIARALEEGTDIVVEGAHVVPGVLDGWEQEFKEAVLVPVVVAVGDEKLHRSHFYRRAAEARYRPGDRYLAAFERIRAIQEYIREQAVERGVPVVEMFDLDSTLQKIVSIVVEKALQSAAAKEGAESPSKAPPAPELPPLDGRIPAKGWQALMGRRRKS